MKRFPIILMVTALGAAGFAAASIASGNHLVQMLTGTNATVTTATTTTTTTTGGEGGGKPGRKVVMCHTTGSKKHPNQTISVDQHAVPAHLRHKDTLGACAPVVKSATTSAPTVTTTKGSDGHGASGDTSSGGHGNAGDHGKGHGKP